MSLIFQFNRTRPKLLTNKQNKGKTKWLLMTEKLASRNETTIAEVSELPEWCTRHLLWLRYWNWSSIRANQKDGRFTVVDVYPNIGHPEKPIEIKCNLYNWVISALIYLSFFEQSESFVARILSRTRMFFGSVVNLL